MRKSSVTGNCHQMPQASVQHWIALGCITLLIAACGGGGGGGNSASSTASPASTAGSAGPAPSSLSSPAPAPAPITYNAKLSWQVPATRADGSPLLAGDLSGYEIYYTTDASTSATYQVSGGANTTYIASNLPAGTYHFAMSAIDLTGQKSQLSVTVTVTFGS